MKVLLLGENGQLGWELKRSLQPLGQLIVCDRKKANLENHDELRQLIREVHPDVIVNAAAYTAVDKAESESEKAHLVNGAAVEVIAEEAKAVNARLIYYSTDYVFDGEEGRAYREDDSVNPINAYGKSKLAGEEAIAQSQCLHFIFRVTWLHGEHGNNFIKQILKLAQERDSLSVVEDQYGAPTGVDFIADITATLLQKLERENSLKDDSDDGIYHLTASGRTNWFDYAKFIIDQSASLGYKMRLTSADVSPLSTDDFPFIATRPKNSSLDNSKIYKRFGTLSSSWESQTKQTLSKIIPKLMHLNTTS